MESLIGNCLGVDEVHLNNHNISSLTPEPLFSPFLAKLFLQENNSLTMIPPSFFHQMPILLVLDLSHTSIQSLPPSISRLCSLEELILRECSLLIEVPPEIGVLMNLKFFDLEGTEIMYLPTQIGKLKKLERLRVSLSTYADEHKDRFGIEHIIPRKTISKLTKLKEFSINVNPEAEWWEAELLEAIMGDLCFLQDLKTLKLYLPTSKALQEFLKLERYRVPIYSSLWNYRFMIGQCEQLPLSVQLDIEENFLKLEKCVKYMNGEGYTDEIVELIKNAKALYIRRHWTIENLSIFDIQRLKYCLLMECNEMQTLVDQEDLYKHKNKSYEILESVQYLSIHFMKKLQRIIKGPIGRNSLSCLRILALHTCPELTSIFTGCFLENMQSLTELIVEDCPKVNCIINLEGTPWTDGPFLVNLKRVSLVDLPELQSISSGVCIAPQLDTLLVFNCMKLDYLSVMEIPKGTKAIKGEIEWWDALKYGKMMWHDVFVQLKRDGDLMDQLAEDTNSLQHFLELETVPSHTGISFQINQNSLRDTNEDSEHVDHIVDSPNETREMSTQNIPHFNKDTQSEYSGTAFKMWEPPSPVSVNPHNEDINYYSKDLNLKPASMKKKHTIMSKHQVKVSKEIKVGKLVDDGHSWRKYGQKEIRGSKCMRSYFRCSFRHTHGCLATKQVQNLDCVPSVFKLIYNGQHTCHTVLHSNCSSTATDSVNTNLKTRDSPSTAESVSTITDSDFEVPKKPQVLDTYKKKSSSTGMVKWTEQVRVSPKTMFDFDIPPDDGYIWRKYGQSEILGAKNSIEYYKCTSCNAKKQVQRSDDDPFILEITYEGMHTCFRLSNATESALSILKNSDFSTATESVLGTLKSSTSSTTAESTSTITDNSSGPEYMNKMSGSASIQRWKQQTNEIQSSSLKLQLASSSITSEPNMTISQVTETSSTNAKKCPPVSKVRKEKLGDKMAELHQLVSPYGESDTASVLMETTAYIKFLQEQVNALMTPYTKQGATIKPQKQTSKQNLRSQGLCLIPISNILSETNQITIGSSSPAIEEPTKEPTLEHYSQKIKPKNKHSSSQFLYPKLLAHKFV